MRVKGEPEGSQASEVHLVRLVHRDLEVSPEHQERMELQDLQA